MHSCTHWLRPRNFPPSPPHLGSYARALRVSQDKRHLFVTPCPSKSNLNILIYLRVSPHCLEGPQQNEAQLFLKPKQNKLFKFGFNTVYCVPVPVSLQNGKSRSFPALLRIRIRIDLHHFVGSGSVNTMLIDPDQTYRTRYGTIPVLFTFWVRYKFEETLWIF